MKITSTKNAAADQGVKLLVYGPAGAGKTRLCGTTPDPENTLILSAEAGLLSLREYDIDAVSIDCLDTLRDAYRFLHASGHSYTWVCLDSISEIAEVALDEEAPKHTHLMKAYGEMATTMAKLIRLFRDLPGLNVYMSAKMEHSQTDEGLILGPMLPGKKLSQGIAYWFDEVFALRCKEGEDGSTIRRLQTASDGAYSCKDRSGALDRFEEASLAHIHGKIHAHID